MQAQVVAILNRITNAAYSEFRTKHKTMKFVIFEIFLAQKKFLLENMGESYFTP